MASDFVRNIKDVRNIDILSRNTVTENDLISTTDGEVYVVTKKGYRKITNIETKDFEALKNQADTNTLNISNLTDDIESLTTTTDTNTSDISNLKTTTDTNTSDISNLKTSTETNTSDISNLKTSTETNTTDISNLKTSTETNTSDISNLKTTTETNTSDISNLKTTTSDNTTNINSTNTLIEQLQQELNDLKANTKQYYTLFEGSANGVGTEINLNDSYKNYSFLNFHVQSNSSNDIKQYEGNNNNSKIVVYTINVTDGDGGDGDIKETQIDRTSETVLTISNEVAWRFSTQAGQEVTNGIVIKKIEGVK